MSRLHAFLCLISEATDFLIKRIKLCYTETSRIQKPKKKKKVKLCFKKKQCIKEYFDALESLGVDKEYMQI